MDLQSTQNQFVVNREVLDALPATRSMQGGASLVPGVSFYSQGFVSTMSVHGSATADQRVYLDGMRIGQNLTGTGSQGNGTGVNDLGQEELVYDAGVAVGGDGARRRAHGLDSQGRRQPVLRHLAHASSRTARCRTTTCPTICGSSSGKATTRLQLATTT